MKSDPWEPKYKLNHNRNKTHCKWGHLLDLNNVRWQRRVRKNYTCLERVCIACANAYQRDRHHDKVIPAREKARATLQPKD